MVPALACPPPVNSQAQLSPIPCVEPRPARTKLDSQPSALVRAGSYVALAKGAWRSLGIGLDDSAVYFATIDEYGGGSVRMRCRPST